MGPKLSVWVCERGAVCRPAAGGRCLCGCVSGVPCVGQLRGAAVCGCVSGVPCVGQLREAAVCGCVSGVPYVGQLWEARQQVDELDSAKKTMERQQRLRRL